MSNHDMFNIGEVTSLLFKIGWAERNGGNISILLDDREFNNIISFFPEKKALNPDILNLSNYTQSFNLLITVSGSRFRNIRHDITSNTGIIKVDPFNNEITWYSSDPNLNPSSEWLSHLSMHSCLLKNNIDKKCIMHSHPTHLIALSHKLIHLSESELNDILWDMMPEVKFFIPKGIGLVPFIESGSPLLAEYTHKKIVDHDVILWSKHGCLALGDTLWEAFESLDIINKAAKIYLLAY